MTEFSDEDVDRIFTEQLTNDSKRVAYCVVGEENRIRSILAMRGLNGMVEVRPSSLLIDPTQVYVVDENAVEAAIAQRMLKMPDMGEFWNP